MRTCLRCGNAMEEDLFFRVQVEALQWRDTPLEVRRHTGETGWFGDKSEVVDSVAAAICRTCGEISLYSPLYAEAWQPPAVDQPPAFDDPGAAAEWPPSDGDAMGNPFA